MISARAVTVVAEMSAATAALGSDRAGEPASVPPVCSARLYHEALSEIETERVRAIRAANQAVRRADPALTGQWLGQPRRSAASATGRTVQSAQGERVCAETVNRGGRQRCLRWETSGAGSDAPPTTAFTAEEARLQGEIEPVMRARGLAVEFKREGRFDWLTERVAQDLRAYTGQAASPTLCNGAPEMTEFHLHHLSPFRKRTQEWKRSAETARRLASIRVALIADRERGADEAPAAAPAETGSEPLDTIIVRLALAMLKEAATGLLAAEPDGFARLSRIAEAIERQGPEAAAPADRAVAAVALRVVEAAAYADLMARRMGTLETALIETIEAVRSAHQRHCTCD